MTKKGFVVPFWIAALTINSNCSALQQQQLLSLSQRTQHLMNNSRNKMIIAGGVVAIIAGLVYRMRAAPAQNDHQASAPSAPQQYSSIASTISKEPVVTESASLPQPSVAVAEPSQLSTLDTTLQPAQNSSLRLHDDSSADRQPASPVHMKITIDPPLTAQPLSSLTHESATVTSPLNNSSDAIVDSAPATVTWHADLCPEEKKYQAYLTHYKYPNDKESLQNYLVHAVAEQDLSGVTYALEHKACANARNPRCHAAYTHALKIKESATAAEQSNAEAIIKLLIDLKATTETPSPKKPKKERKQRQKNSNIPFISAQLQ